MIMEATMATKYGMIVFMQGDDCDEFDKIMDESGQEAAFDHLNQWNYGEGYDGVPQSTRPGDNWHERTSEQNGQLMMWSAQYGYCALYDIIEGAE